MKTTLLVVAMLALWFANSAVREKLLTSDPLTSLPLIPATDSGKNLGNEPTPMPGNSICKSKMQAEFYKLYNIKVDVAAEWYSSHLTGFKKAQGSAQTAFYNSDGTIVVFVTGKSGADAYSVAYERFQPGLSEKTITSVTDGKIVCQ